MVKTMSLKNKSYAWLMGFTAGTGAKVPVTVPSDPKRLREFNDGKRYGEMVRDGKATVHHNG